MGKKVMLLDGNSLVHRAFHALPLLSNRGGVFTNAVLGFTTMLFKLLKNEKPDYIAVAFDKGRTFRHDEYEKYKAHRKPVPDELRHQFVLVKDILSALNIKIFEYEGYEADDILGTLAKKAEEEGLEPIIVTGDSDALQLVSPSTKVMLTRKGISQIETFDIEKIKEKYNLEPKQLVDVKALMGDASDNIPGVPGIGEKTALKLIREFKDIDNLLKNLAKLPSKKLMKNIKEHQEQLLMSRMLAEIRTDLELEGDILECRTARPDYDRLLKIFDELDFRKLTKEVLEEMKLSEEEEEKNNGEKKNVEEIDNVERLSQLIEGVLKSKKAAMHFVFEGSSYFQSRIIGFGLSFDGKSYALNLNDSGKKSEDKLLQVLKPLFENHTLDIILYDSKKTIAVLKVKGIDINFLPDDIMIAAYLLNPSASGYDIQYLALEYLDKTVVEPENPGIRAACYAELIMDLRDELVDRLKIAQMDSLYYDLELPLARILAKMEISGVTLDRERLKEMSQEFAEKIEEVTSEIYELAGEEFNINSPKQLAYILFEKLKLPVIKRTKTGYSTDAAVLEELAQYHEIAAKILYYRQLMKLKSTYLDAMDKLVDEKTGRIHTTFNQTITATGRLSSAEPNLQNIPVRLEIGRKIRKLFIPKYSGWFILAADYSQIELRVMAHLSEDENLRKAFLKGEDIHARTASEVFGVKIEDVDRNMRRMAKAVNFGIIYGISDFGLARDLGISRQEAKRYIEKYFQRYPGVKAYMEKIVEEAREKGYVTTILNRRRYIPELFSTNRNVRGFGERTAINTPIQGSAADIIKLAMLRVDKEIENSSLKVEMVLQVHDELIFEVAEEDLQDAAVMIKREMEGAYNLRVPLVVDLKYGKNWYDMEPLEL
ncbi:MAG: DNA polymerase [Clostridia bacterium 41_269]|nr:MAG: DNA polymerase [Clostridia bacterium 41_269]